MTFKFKNHYNGRCSMCCKYYEAVLATQERVIPPPFIVVNCGCNIPVHEVRLVFVHSFEKKKEPNE